MKWAERASEAVERSRALRFLARTAASFIEHRAPARAAALSYTTLLALVPLTALVVSVSTSILQGSGAGWLEALVDRFLTYAVPQLNTIGVDEVADIRVEVLARMSEAIERIDAGALGLAGTIVLTTVGILLLSSVEHALNDVWSVRRGRPLSQRVVYYWTGVTLGPIVLIFALSMTSQSVMTNALGILPGSGLSFFRFLAPGAVLATGFTLLYWLMPNTRVRLRDAAAGGVAAAVLFQANNLASALYLSRVAGYSRVYGSVGAIPILMVGLYLSWLIVLLGAEVARNLPDPGEETTSPPRTFAGRARLILDVAREAAAAYLRGEGGSTPEEIAERLELSVPWVENAFADLAEGGLFVASEHEGRYVPARPLDDVPATALLDVVRGTADEPGPAASAPVERVLAAAFEAERKRLEGTTLADLARESAQRP